MYYFLHTLKYLALGLTHFNYFNAFSTKINKLLFSLVPEVCSVRMFEQLISYPNFRNFTECMPSGISFTWENYFNPLLTDLQDASTLMFSQELISLMMIKGRMLGFDQSKSKETWKSANMR